MAQDWSNYVGAAATLITGFFVFVVYRYTSRAKKIEAATILLSTIDAAEREIGKIKSTKVFNKNTCIINSNYWILYQNLFVRHFDSVEIIKISEFFKNCVLAQASIGSYVKYLDSQIDQKSRSFQDKLVEEDRKSVV